MFKLILGIVSTPYRTPNLNPQPNPWSPNPPAHNHKSVTIKQEQKSITKTQWYFQRIANMNNQHLIKINNYRKSIINI